METESVLWKIGKFLYTAIKVILVVGFIVGLSISAQCHGQLVEICQMAGGCD